MGRSSLKLAIIVACLIALVAASWSKEDQEIFRLRDEIELHEGVGVNFYDFLGIKTNANQDDIAKAFKKKSRTLHPDKVKQKLVTEKSTDKDGNKVKKVPSRSEVQKAQKGASDRFARLGVVKDIIKGPGRERYDHFLGNGFPKWRSTGYYYARYRPGLGTVLAGLFIFVGGGGHWLALYMSWKRQQEFVGRYIKFARHAAWGGNLNVPGLDSASTPNATGDEFDPSTQPINRRQRRMQEKDTKKDKAEKKPKKAAKASPAATPPVGATGPRKRVVAENGKVLVVDSVGNVYLEQADEDGHNHEFLLDPEQLAKPTIKDTALVRVPIWAFNRTAGRFLNKAPVEEDFEDDEGQDTPPSSSSGAEDFEVLEKVKTSAQNGSGKVMKRKKSARGGK